MLITGRSERSLAEVARAHPGVETFAGDLSDPADREKLAWHVRETMPELDLLINNAGIQRRVALAADDAPWAERQIELDTLLAAPVHLDHLLVPVLLAHGRPAAIVEVTSGGAIIPQPFAPLYSACKAALHSYTVTLRHSLAYTNCRVIELMPPAVATALAGPGNTHGAPLEEFCDAALAGIDRALTGGPQVIGYGMTTDERIADRLHTEQQMFDTLSSRFPTTTYAGAEERRNSH
ncbi:uncharacterized oxidoreductase [Streptosporangium subroseum]|uniref:Uncharacterized oxidoreductase n=1 Tax=Streptosporangium subroseum TaxID=106412 RepID=A0A239P1J7_9ACTN|nr:uncharacterized oxidoreductase [Streptosporangium subroseum]